MGNLQSVLGDCQLGEVPAYLQQYMGKADAGDEAYMVYNERSGFRPAAAGSSRPRDGFDGADASMYYSGPTQQVVRAKLLEKEHDEAAQSRNRKVLAELVDLCVDGIDDANARDPSASRAAKVPGGQAFAAPRVQDDNLTAEVWDEAASQGVVRASPWERQHASGDDPDADKKKKKKKKKRRDRDAKPSAHDGEGISGRVDAIVEGYPDTLKELLREDKTGTVNVDAASDASASGANEESAARLEQGTLEVAAEEAYSDADPDAEYESEVDASERGQGPGSRAATPEAADPETDPALASSGGGPVVSGGGAVDGKDSSGRNTPSGNDQGSVRVQREEEAKLLARLNILVAPFEEPKEPIDTYYLVDAEWFRDWSAFLKGAARPGQIENGKLLDDDGQPWPELDAGRDYIAVDRVAWNLLQDIYGADHEIFRPSYDLYA